VTHPAHLVDTTMFFCPRGGGVRRYLLAKQAWLKAHAPHIRHTLLVPDPQQAVEGIVTCQGRGIPLGDGYRFPVSRARWRKSLLECAPDLIEAGDPYVPAWATRDAGQRLGIPVTAFFHSDLPRMLEKRAGGWTQPLARAYLRNLYGGFDLVLAPSRAMLEKLDAMGVANIALQSLGVDTEIFRARSRHADIRRQLGLPSHTRLLVYAGRFAREKHLDVLLSAVVRLGSPYHLLLVGGETHARIGPHATVLPYERSEARLARLLASCDALVHAGNEETFGLILIEAMACGIPVVAVGSGGIRELVEDDVGLLATRSEAGEMAAAIAALFERDVHAMGVAARERAVRLYSWDAAFRQLLRHYAGLRGEQTNSLGSLVHAAEG